MKLSVVFATPDKALRTFIGLRKERLIPASAVAKSYFERSGASFRVTTLRIDQATSAPDLAQQILHQSTAVDGLMLLIDDQFNRLADGVRDAAFVVPFEHHYPGMSVHNRVAAMLAPALRHYAYLAERFDDAKFRKLLLLPLNIFKSAELAGLRELVTRGNRTPGFGERLDGLLSTFRSRQVPKKRTAYPDKYVRDDRPLFFQYGHETHDIIETHPPHTTTCAINSDFRFGLRYDNRRHFNVSEEAEEDSVSGEFLSCHRQIVTIRKRTHVNVFPNGFL